MKNDNKTKRNLIGTNYCTDFYTYESYVEYCKANETEPEGEDSQDYWDYVSMMEQQDYEDFFGNLKYAKADKGNYIVTFDLGLWNGHRKGYVEEVFGNLTDAIKECMNSSRDYNDYKVEYEDGMLRFHGLHHDGTNVMEIRLLSKKGERALLDPQEPDWEKAINNKVNFKILKYNDLF